MNKSITLLPTLEGIDYPKNTTVQWHGLDTEPLFQKNLKKFGSNWYFAKNEITYSINSQGYRCEEFNKINWKDCYVVVGCSHIFGSGNKEEDTIPHLIQKQTGIKCINLGVPSSSCEHQFLNTLLLLSYTQVKKIIVVWTYPTRTNIYEKTKLYRLDRLINNYVISNSKTKKYNKELMHDLILLTFGNINHSLFLLDTYKQIFSKGSIEQYDIRDLEKEFGGHNHHNLNNKKNPPDLARDMQHYGPIWNKLVADKISLTLK